jgi:hypothetical protein
VAEQLVRNLSPFRLFLPIDAQIILAGHLPPKVVKIIRDWAKSHETELYDNWTRIQNNEPTQYITGADND